MTEPVDGMCGRRRGKRENFMGKHQSQNDQADAGRDGRTISRCEILRRVRCQGRIENHTRLIHTLPRDIIQADSSSRNSCSVARSSGRTTCHFEDIRARRLFCCPMHPSTASAAEAMTTERHEDGPNAETILYLQKKQPLAPRSYSVCVCFLPIHSGHQVRWTYQPGSHRRKVTQDF